MLGWNQESDEIQAERNKPYVKNKNKKKSKSENQKARQNFIPAKFCPAE